MSTRPIHPCCFTQSPNFKRAALACCVITAVVAAVFLALGVAGVFPPAGNFPSMVAGGAVLALAVMGMIVAFCSMKAPRDDIINEAPPEQQTESVNANLAEIAKAPKERLHEYLFFFVSRDFQDLEAFKACVDRMVIEGVSIADVTDIERGTIFHDIAMEGTPEMLHYLESKGVPFIDKRGPNNSSSVLHDAARYGKAEHLAIFLKWGADVNAQDVGGNTPLHIAMWRKKVECVKALVEAGCKIDLKDDQGYTVFDLLKKMNDLSLDIKSISTYLSTRFPEIISPT